MEHIYTLFENQDYIRRIQAKLPALFQLAEIESSRAGKIGMEVGTIRERILVALLLYVYGEDNVETNIPTTEAEIDVKLYEFPISIKTFTGKKWSSIKLIWTVDPYMAKQFQDNYIPKCGMLLTQINWGGLGGLFYFSVQSQRRILNQIGRERYIKLPAPGTNPRGVEISAEALTLLVMQEDTKKILLSWSKQNIEFNAFDRWTELWASD